MVREVTAAVMIEKYGINLTFLLLFASFLFSFFIFVFFYLLRIITATIEYLNNNIGFKLKNKSIARRSTINTRIRTATPRSNSNTRTAYGEGYRIKEESNRMMRVTARWNQARRYGSSNSNNKRVQTRTSSDGVTRCSSNNKLARAATGSPDLARATAIEQRSQH